MADVLRSVNGVYVTDDRNYSYVGMRLTIGRDYNSRCCCWWMDTAPTTACMTGGCMGRKVLDVDLIERVEVVREFLDLREQRLLAWWNVITRRGHSLNGLETTGEVGDNKTVKGGTQLQESA